MTETELYRHYDKGGHLLYVGISLSSICRLSQHKTEADWFKTIARVEIERFPSREQAEAAEIRAIQEERPIYNVIHNTICVSPKAKKRAKKLKKQRDIREMSEIIGQLHAYNMVRENNNIIKQLS